MVIRWVSPSFFIFFNIFKTHFVRKRAMDRNNLCPVDQTEAKLAGALSAYWVQRLFTMVLVVPSSTRD